MSLASNSSSFDSSGTNGSGYRNLNSEALKRLRSATGRQTTDGAVQVKQVAWELKGCVCVCEFLFFRGDHTHMQRAHVARRKSLKTICGSSICNGRAAAAAAAGATE